MPGGTQIRAGRAFVEIEAVSKVNPGMKRVQRDVRLGLGSAAMIGAMSAAGTLMGQAMFSALSSAFNVGARAMRSGIGFLHQSVNQASHWVETTNKMDVAFGDNADAMESWAKTYADNIGRSRQQTRDYVAQLKLLANSFGITGGMGTDFSKIVTELAFDIGSLFDVADEEALRAVRSALVGQTEPLKRIGAAAPQMGEIKRFLEDVVEIDYAKANQTQRSLAALALIIEATEQSAGDAAKTMDTYQNLKKRLTAASENLAISIGGKLIPVWEVFTSALVTTMNHFEAAIANSGSLEDVFVGLAERMGPAWSSALSSLIAFTGHLSQFAVTGDFDGMFDTILISFKKLMNDMTFFWVMGWKEMLQELYNDVDAFTGGNAGFFGPPPAANANEIAKEWLTTLTELNKQQGELDARAQAAFDKWKAEVDKLVNDARDRAANIAGQIPDWIRALGDQNEKAKKARSLSPAQALKPLSLTSGADLMFLRENRRGAGGIQAQINNKLGQQVGFQMRIADATEVIANLVGGGVALASATGL